MEFILAQVFGIIALIATCISYFLEKRSHFVITQIVVDIFYAAAFIVSGALVAGVITCLSAARCVYLYFAERYELKHKNMFLSLFVVAYIIVTIIFMKSWLDIVPLITSILFSVGVSIENLQVGRYVLLLPNAILVVYNILITTYASAILDAIEFAVIVVAIVKWHIKHKHTKPNCDGALN